MVQLKHLACDNDRQHCKFQFHNGTIKTTNGDNNRYNSI